jgi:hypothetical protein
VPRDFAIAVPEDRPTAVAEVGEALGAAGINIEGLSSASAGGVMHVLVADFAAARHAFEDAGLTVLDERDVILRSLKQRDRPGTWGRLARRLVERGVAIEFCYLATDTRIVIGVDDYDKAIAAIQIYGG